MKKNYSGEKLLLLITNYGIGGAQRAFYDHATFLSKKYKVTEAVFDIKECPIVYPTSNEVLSLDVRAEPGVRSKISNFKKRCQRLKDLVAKKDVDLCISHMDGANWVNVLSRSKAKKILLVQGTVLHDYDVKRWLQVLRRRVLIPYLYNRASVTVAVSDGIKHELQRYCGVRKVVTIPNFFDIESIKQRAQVPLAEEEEQFFTQYKVLVTSGRFHDQKKQRYLFPLFKKLKEKDPQLKLMLLGDGDLREELMTEASRNGLTYYSVWNKEQKFSGNNDVYFMGYRENPFQYLKRSTLFLFPSGWEGFPLALCEAVISGVPVLSADCPTGPREILAPGTFDVHYILNKPEYTEYGVLLPMTDKPQFETAWVEAVERLLANEALRSEMARKCSERIKEFDKEVAIKKWMDLIEEVLHS